VAKTRCQVLSEPITEEIWNRIDGLPLPKKVRQLISIFKAHNNEPFPTSALPVEICHSVTQQANAIFLHAGIPCRIFPERPRLHWCDKKIKLYTVKVFRPEEKNPLSLGVVREFAITGKCLVTEDGFIKIVLRPSSAKIPANALSKAIAEIRPQTTRLTTKSELKDEIVIELKGSPTRDQQP
jgi:hypothetical protein